MATSLAWWWLATLASRRSVLRSDPQAQGGPKHAKSFFFKSGVCLAGVLITRAVLFRAHIGAPDFLETAKESRINLR